MIVTTTHELQGKNIHEYLGIVGGETILAIRKSVSGVQAG